MGPTVQHIRIHKERRGGRVATEWQDRRTYCWMIENCDPTARARCHAYIVEENCWDFWAVKGAKYRACCHKLDDCRDCPIVRQRFTAELPVYVRPPQPPTLPSGLAAVICDRLHVIGGAIPEGRALRQFLRQQMQDDRDSFRCRQRGVHLDPGYVAEVCATRASLQCVFLP